MKRRVLSTLLGSGCPRPLCSARRWQRAGKEARAGTMKLNVGDIAPEFKMQYFDGSGLKDVSLSQYRGKSNVVLAFYIFAFTGG